MAGRVDEDTGKPYFAVDNPSCSAPENFVVVNANPNFPCAWDPVPGATGYILQVLVNGVQVQVQLLPAGTSGYVVTLSPPAKAGDKVTFKLAALCPTGGQSPFVVVNVDIVDTIIIDDWVIGNLLEIKDSCFAPRCQLRDEFTLPVSTIYKPNEPNVCLYPRMDNLKGVCGEDFSGCAIYFERAKVCGCLAGIPDSSLSNTRLLCCLDGAINSIARDKVTIEQCTGDRSGQGANPAAAPVWSPNPFHDLLSLRLPEETDTDHLQIALTDLSGRVTMLPTRQNTGNSYVVQLPQLPPGFYTYTITNGVQIWRGILIKQLLR